VIHEEAERRLLAAYIHGLRGVVGQQVQFQMPSTMEQAIKLAVTIENVEKHKQLKEGPRKVFAARKDVTCYRCAQVGHYAKNCRQGSRSSGPGRRSWHDHGDRWRDGPSRYPPANQGGRNRRGSRGLGFRRPQRPGGPSDDGREAGIQCFHCREMGHRH
jgi:hypothetical protein